MNYPLPKETKFSQFLRYGGKSEFVVRFHPRRFELKSDHLTDEVVTQFHHALQVEAERVFERVKDVFSIYSPNTFLDFDARNPIEIQLAQLKEALEADPSQAGKIDTWVHRFGAEPNREWQVELGVTRYIWRSKDDDKVRSRHAQYDDQIFSWDEPPEGGHPGEGYNCRCFAEPFLAEGQFQTRDENSVFENVGGEFVCNNLISCASIDINLLGPGDWTTLDRVNNTKRWQEANRYNLSQEDGYLKYVGNSDFFTLKIRAIIYKMVQEELTRKGHDVKWPGTAGEAVEAAWYLYAFHSTDPEMVGMIMTANDSIIADVWAKLVKLNNQELILTGEAAKEWDMQMLAHEQNLVQPIYDQYGETEAMATYEANAKRETWYSNWLFNNAGGVGLPIFEGNIRNPIDRWIFGMNAMGYENANPSQMPKTGK